MMDKPVIRWTSQHEAEKFRDQPPKLMKEWLKYYMVEVLGLEGNSLSASVSRKFKNWTKEDPVYRNVKILYEERS
jgi:hypothetical protein